RLMTKLAAVINEPQIDVSVLTYVSQRVWVTGAARQASVVPITMARLTLQDAISTAGFDPSQADLSGVRLTRDDVTHVLDVSRLGSTPIYLRAGDQIYI